MIPQLTMLTMDWKWLFDSDQFTLLEISPFGDLFMRDPTGALCLLDVNLGELQYAEIEGTNPDLLFPIAFDMSTANGYIKAGLLPVDGQCFGYKQQLVAGGSLESHNVYIATHSEYISFMGDFHRQIQDVPDGTTVDLKVINRKVIQ
jgi:hypothetical protein